MRVSDFDYELPEELIAQFPTPRRRDSRLLVLDPASGGVIHRTFPDIAEYLHPGDLYPTETIRQRLNMRDFMDTLRASGIYTGGPPALSKSDRQSFANHLDRMLTRYAKG